MREEVYEQLMPILMKWIERIRVGDPSESPEPFMGSLINENAADSVLNAQSHLMGIGAEPLLFAKKVRSGTALVSPGLIDCTNLSEPYDEEIFGPLLQVYKVSSFEEALEKANATKFGLSAGLIADDPSLFERFYQEINAGIINFNQQLTGASSAASFGGIGLSGNHRPSAFLAADYCSYPVSGIHLEEAKMPPNVPTGIN